MSGQIYKHIIYEVLAENGVEKLDTDDLPDNTVLLKCNIDFDFDKRVVNMKSETGKIFASYDIQPNSTSVYTFTDIMVLLPVELI